MPFSFKRLFGFENRVAPVAPSAFFHGIPGWAIADGMRFSQNEALAVSALWGCVMVITRALAASPWNVYELDKDGRRTPRNAKNDTVFWLLNVQPNPETTAISFKEALSISMLTTGNGYAEIQFDGAGRPLYLWPLEADRMELRRDEAKPYTLYYQYTDGVGNVRRLELYDVLHWRGPSSSAILGDNLITRFVRTIGLQVALQKFSIAYFANGANSNLVLSHPKSLSTKAADRLRQDVKERSTGANNAGKPLVLEEGMSATPISMTMVENGVVDQMKLGVVEICRLFQVPPHLIGHLDGGTGQYNNLEASGQGFVRDCLTPWARRLEQEVAVKLLGGRGGANRVNEIQLNWLSRGDAVARATAAKMLREAGIVCADEIRRQEGLEDWGGEEGEELFISNSFVTVSSLSAAKDPEIYQYHLAAGIPTVNEVRARLKLPAIEGGDEPTTITPEGPASTVVPPDETPASGDPMTAEPDDATDDSSVASYAQAIIGACLERYGARLRARRRDIENEKYKHTPEQIEALLEEERARLAPRVSAEIVAALRLSGKTSEPNGSLTTACLSVEAGADAAQAAATFWSTT